MSNEDFEWNLDEPLDEGEMISKYYLRDLLPGLSMQDADDMIFYAEHFGVNTADKIRLINQMRYMMRHQMLTWSDLQWRWLIEHISNLIAKSRERYSAVQNLNERIAVIEEQLKTLSREPKSGAT